MSSGSVPAVNASGRAKSRMREAERPSQAHNGQEADTQIKEMGAIPVACFEGIYGGVVAEGAAVGRVNAQQLEELGMAMKELQPSEMGELAPLAKVSECHEEG